MKEGNEMRKQLRLALPLIIPAVVSLAVWLPLIFLGGGSLMGKAELTEHLGPVLTSEPGLADWSMLPLYPTLRPYIELLFDSPEFFVMFWNSVKLVLCILVGQLIAGVPAAWGFAQYRFPGRGILFTLYIALMLMPFQVTMVSSYLVLDGLSLMNTHLAVILPCVFSTFPVFILYRFFCAIPRSVLEAAELDGAGPLQIFWHIGLPMGAPGVMAAAVLGFLEYWNLIEQPMTFLSDPSLWPLSLYLPNITSDKIGLALAASVVTLTPAILVFFYGQRYLEQGIIAASVKE